MEATHIVFADPLSDDHFERQRKMLRLDRFYAAYEDGIPVGTAADYEFRLTVPGGELAAGGVTWVGVLPSHRRRGVLTQLMRGGPEGNLPGRETGPGSLGAGGGTYRRLAEGHVRG